MNASENDECGCPPAVVDAVKASIDKTYASLCGETPKLITNGDANGHDGPRIAGVISFLGNIPWTLSWILTEKTAPVLAQKFTGFEIPFDSSDMGDMAAELVNVVAGEIISQLERRGIKSQMSLPTVLRGAPLELIPENGPSVTELEYTSGQGSFSIRLATASSGKHLMRMPGKQLEPATCA